MTIPALYILTPTLGMLGASISVSLTYFAIVTYNWIAFKRMNKVSLKDLLVKKEDLDMLIAEIKNMRKSSNS